MNPRARIASFALVLGAAFAAAFLLGSGFDSVDTDAGGAHRETVHDDAGATTHEGGSAHGAGSENGHGGDQQDAAKTTPGLAVAEGGYTLRLSPTQLQPGESRELRFRIEDSEGATVHHFDELHERDMHLIVVRRDGAHFQHLHPEMDSDGTWTIDLTLPAAGVYRLFADFSVGGEPLTMASDLFARGSFRPQPFPAGAPVDRVGGYEVRLRDGALTAGAPSALRFLVSRRGGEATEIESYLGAKGHLVALREGDLAFLHVHPDEGKPAPSVIPYTATFPTAGRYRLYLQFKHAGQVRTAGFTVAVRR
ncbi:MAG: hypothetical protein WA862_11240 [Solirubrobacterales bacterium]